MYESTQSPADDLVSGASITDSDINQFQECGFVKLKSLLTQGGVRKIREEARRLSATAQESDTEYGSTFNRLAYGLGDTDLFQSLYRSINFRNAVLPIIGSPLIVTESQCFELAPEKQGFEWHYNSISFRYIRQQDPGYSLWIALDPVVKESKVATWPIFQKIYFPGMPIFSYLAC